MESDPTLPSTEDVIRKTEQITKNIQELLRAAQENKHDRSDADKKTIYHFRICSFSSLFYTPSSCLTHLLYVVVYVLCCFFHYRLLPSPASLCSAVMIRSGVTVSLPSPYLLPPTSRPCEREGVRRLRHSLGCFSTLVPWAEKAPSPLQPLSLRSPDPTSWYSGLCPCLPGTVLFSSPSHSHPTHPPLSFFSANKRSFWRAVQCSAVRNLTFGPQEWICFDKMQLCKVACLHSVGFNR